MDQITLSLLLFVFGLMMGSFAGATVWRLRARQLIEDKKAGEKIDKEELRHLQLLVDSTFANDRSRCLHCGHMLAWYDLIPLLSWASTRGKCRYCRKTIGWFEPTIELATGLLFLSSYLYWPLPLASATDIFLFSLWIVASVLLVILFAYDAKWYLLPNRIVFPFIAVASMMAITILLQAHGLPWSLLNLLLAVLILSGLYFVLWVASKGAWIGFGDVKLGLGLALLLGQWQLAFLALFFANIIGCILVIPGLISGKITRQTRIPFGPLLILGAVIAMLWGGAVINWYFLSFA